MLIECIKGSKNDFDLANKNVDIVDIDWFEVNKKVLKKESRNGKDVGFRLAPDIHLHHNDVIYIDNNEVLIINISESEAIVIRPSSMEEMGKICYEIGNKHVPLFMHDDEIAVPYDEPLMRLLEKKGFKPEKAMTRLTNGLECHHHDH